MSEEIRSTNLQEFCTQLAFAVENSIWYKDIKFASNEELITMQTYPEKVKLDGSRLDVELKDGARFKITVEVVDNEKTDSENSGESEDTGNLGQDSPT